MSLERKIARRNRGLRVVNSITAATAVGSVACTGVIVVALAAQSGALVVEAPESVTVLDTDVIQGVPTPSVVGKDKAAKPVARPKPAKTPPAPAPKPSNNGGNGGKSNGS